MPKIDTLGYINSEIKKWNWGAFFLTWIWGVGNNTLIPLLALIPLVNLVMPFVLDAKGNEWAWQNKKWKSIDHFKEVQKKWATRGLIVFIVFLFIYLIAFSV